MNFLASIRHKLFMPMPTLKNYLHISPASYAIDKQLLGKLRKSTGFSFVNCRKALEKFDNDIKQAEKWLKDEAQKEGWAKASKLQGRPMSQGLIGLVIKDNLASLVEVNCETDFVARNIKFQSFIATVVDAVLQHGKSSGKNKILLSQDQLNKLQINDKSILDLTALEVGNLGENILVRRAVVMKPKKESGQYLSYYVHATGLGPKVQQNSGACLLGKYAAMVICQEGQATTTTTTIPTTSTTTATTTTATPTTATTTTTNTTTSAVYKSTTNQPQTSCKQKKQDDDDDDSSSSSSSSSDSEEIMLEKKILPKEELGRQLCQHIVGMSPKCVGYEDDINNDINKDINNDINNDNLRKNSTSLKSDTKIDENSSVDAVVDVDDGKPVKAESEELRLIHQEFMMDANYKVIDVLIDNNIKVVDFIRIECGEDIEGGEVDEGEKMKKKEEL